MACVGSQALLVRQRVPYFTRSILRSRKYQMAIGWKELDFLYSFRMPYKCVNPLFGYEIFTLLFCVIFNVRRCLNKFLILALHMKYGRLSLLLILLRPFSLLFMTTFTFDSLFNHVLVLFYSLILLIGQFRCLLMFEFFHAFVVSPGSFIVWLFRIAGFLPLLLPFSFQLLFAFLRLCRTFHIFVEIEKAAFKLVLGDVRLLHEACVVILAT